MGYASHPTAWAHRGWTCEGRPAMRNTLRLLCVVSLVGLSWQQDAELEHPHPLAACDGGRPMAETSQGPICGVHCPDGPVEVCGKPSDDVMTRKYKAFSGIPFAKPPVNELRFKAPVPAEAWSDYRDGGWMPPMCPQFDMMSMLRGNFTAVGNEDWLFLNVYVPEDATPPASGFPVMVWIHGGAFMYGGVQEYYANKLMTRDVIIVSIQYRLAILGWLSTDDEVAPGNLLLKDQELSLRWVQENIANFGGDPSMVTIFGESAGSISVHHQLLNPGAKGLFSRAIMQSGTALMNLYPTMDHREHAFKVATKLGCSINNEDDGYDSEELITCLRNVSATAFVNIALTFVEFGFAPYAFSPRYGEATVPGSPAQLLREGRYNMVDIMMGINQHEGGLVSKGLFMIPNALKDIANNFSNVGHHNFYMDKTENDVAAEMFKFYMGEIREYNEEDMDRLTEMFGDYLMDMPHDYSIELHGRDSLYGKNVYAYELQYKATDGLAAFYGESKVVEDYINHGDDLSYLFKFDPSFVNNTIVDPEGKKLESIMLDLWTNFATHGNPTPDRSLGFTWAPVNLKSTDHLILKPEPYMEADTRCERRSVYTTFNISINRELFPDRVAAGPNWKPWRVQDQKFC